MLLLFFLIIIPTSLSAPARRQAIQHMIPFNGISIVNRDQWVCGSGYFTERASQSAMTETCDEKTPEFNMCCAIHDSCYDNQKGRERCDNHFCNCLDVAMSQPGLPITCLSQAAAGACALVRNLGQDSYESPKPDRMSLRAYHPALNQTAKHEYKLLYSHCPGFRKPLTTCAYNHQVCYLRMRPSERYNQEYTDCREELISCLVGASEFLMDHIPTCQMQVKVAVRAIKDDARESGMGEEMWASLEEVEETTNSTMSSMTEANSTMIEESSD